MSRNKVDNGVAVDRFRACGSRSVCVNCSYAFEGSYCPRCGQQAGVRRLTFKAVVDNLAYGITNLDRGVLYTLKGLFTNPGFVIRDYIAGRRVMYAKPFALLVLLCGIYALVTAFTNIWYGGICIASDNGALEVPMTLLEKVGKNMLVMMLLQLPFFALFTRWMFRGWGYNYTEMLFASAFISCQQAVIYVLFAALMFWIPGSVPYLNVISSFSMMVLMAWSLKGLFGVSWWSASVKTLVINILSIIVVAVALLLAVFLGTVIALNFGILT